MGRGDLDVGHRADEMDRRSKPADPNPQGGIWQGAGPIMSDKPGELLVVTANGSNPAVGPVTDSAPGALGQSIVRLAVQPDHSLRPVDYFSPANADDLGAADVGIGSGAAELLPSGYFGTPTVPNLAVTGSKHGSIYVVDRSFLGGHGQGPGGGDGIVQRFDNVGPMWSTPAFWVGDGGYFYQTVAFHGLQVYQQGVGAGDVPTFRARGVDRPGRLRIELTGRHVRRGDLRIGLGVDRRATRWERRAARLRRRTRERSVPLAGQVLGRAVRRSSLASPSPTDMSISGRSTAVSSRSAPAALVPREFTAISPNRILDTRIGLGRPGANTAPLGEGETFDVQVTGTAGIRHRPRRSPWC